MIQKQPPEVFCKKGVLKNLAKFKGKHLWQGLLFNKVAGPRPATILKKRFWHRCFPVSFAKFPKTPFYRTPLDDCFWWYPNSNNDHLRKKTPEIWKFCVANCWNYLKKYRNLYLDVRPKYEDAVRMKQYFVAQKTDCMYYQSCFVKC